MYCGRERTINNKILTTDQCISLCQKKGFKFIENKIINNKTVIFFICPKHECAGVQQMTYQNMKRDGFGCKYCRSSRISHSIGEKKVKEFLDKLGIKYIQQYKFNDCVDQAPLPFDFYLYEYNIIIEYDGQHHYYPVQFNGVTIEEAKQTHDIVVKHDEFKNNYCKKT